MFGPAWCASLVNDGNRGFYQSLGQFARVGDGGTGTAELGRAALGRTDAPQSSQHISDMAAKDTPVGVHLV